MSLHRANKAVLQERLTAEKNRPVATGGEPENCPSGRAEQVEPACVVIVSRNTLQSALLKTYLEQESAPEAPCRVCARQEWNNDASPADGLMQSAQDTEDEVDQPELVLLDCFGVNTADLWVKLGLGGGPNPAFTPMALFNVAMIPDQDVAFERQAIERRIRGVFYQTEPPRQLLRGMTKILQGEIWFSRKTTSRILMDAHYRRSEAEIAEASLTPREKEILIAIASGAGNNDIAESFFISPHTVKTHLYNIYRKIDVNNRLEATFWVAKYL